MKIGFVGVGGIAPFHLQAFKLAGAEVVAVTSRSESAISFAREYKIPHSYQNVEEMLENCALDGVCVLTQPSSYAEVLPVLKKSNVPTLLEKPISYTVEQAIELKKYLPETVFVGLNRRFYSNVQKIKPLVEKSNEIFAQLYIPERAKDLLSRDELTRNHWHMANGIHGVDLLTYLVGPAKEFYSRTAWGKLEYTKLSRFHTARYQTTRGHQVSFMMNFDSPGGWRIHLFLPELEIRISPFEQTIVKTLKGEEVISIDEEDRIAKPGFLNQAKCFLSGIDRPSSSIKNWVSYEEALTSMKVVDAIFAGQ